ncbi:NAD(P)H-hydrate dehydratase [Tundrisphaera sp. TA3]|uniref:NAD(P)H-hydrate dehydratase n=1 Tax=Tundrisphaera sp. TA3 TaxID=3435775 RepID=UPI003EC08D70
MSASPKLIHRALLETLPLPEHDKDEGKAGRGKLLLIAGSASLPGAAILAARGALRVGCGTVRVAAPRSVAVTIGVAVPELMVLPLPETDSGTIAESALTRLEEQLGPCDAAVIGPGLGSHQETDRVSVRFLAGSSLPTVVDAGALLAWGRAGWPDGPGDRVLTPHAPEMAQLSGLEPETIASGRAEVAGRFSAEWRSVIVLKGAQTLVAGRELYLNTAGTPGLGTAGSGDLLAGVIGGLLARGAEPTTAAVWGVHLHAIAGEIAAGRHGDDGMLASDVLDCLPDAMRSLREGRG